MSEALNTIKYNIELYYGDFVFLGIAVIAFIYLAVTCKELRGKILFPIGLILFCIVNPILYKFVFSKIIYWRLFWTIPDAMIIALAGTKFIQARKNNVFKVGILATAVALIVVCGKNAFKENEYSKAENWYKLNNEVIEVCDIIFNHGQDAKCIMPRSLYSEIRQYDSDIKQMYGRDADMYIFESLSTISDVSAQANSDNPNYNTVLAMADFYGYNYIVVDNGKNIDNALLQQYGYILMAVTETHIIYCKERKISDDNDWIITQYGYDGKSQRTFYTMEDKDGHLIIVDGGNEWDKKVYEVINDHGGHVDAWIITTPKRENVGAFNNILSTYPEIVIDEVYTIDVNYERYKETAKEYDYFEAFEKFYNLTQNMNNINYVHEGDRLNVCGLTIDVLNAWDEETDEHENKLTSYGSMSFVVKGDTESMLFCGETAGNIGDKILSSQNLQNVTYMQVAHRGYNGMPLEFYDKITPQSVFIDQSLSYVETNEKKEKLQQILDVKNLYEDKNVKVYTFYMAPNKVILK